MHFTRMATLVIMFATLACNGRDNEQSARAEEGVDSTFQAVYEPAKSVLVNDSVPTANPVELYREASLLLAKSRNSVGMSHESYLNDAIRLFLLAADSLPEEVKPDIKQALNTVMNLEEYIYDQNLVVDYLLEAWDRGVDRSIIRSPLLAYKKKYEEEARKEGFNKNSRYREEDVFRHEKDLTTCTDVIMFVLKVYEISWRLHTSDAYLWKRARADLTTRNVECEGIDSTVGETQLSAGYDAYVSLGLPEDARRVAKVAIRENLELFTIGDISDISGKIIEKPGNAVYLDLAKMWATRVPPTIAVALWRKYAKRAEEFENFGPAEILYQELGDNVNARRMKMKGGIKSAT